MWVEMASMADYLLTRLVILIFREATTSQIHREGKKLTILSQKYQRQRRKKFRELSGMSVRKRQINHNCLIFYLYGQPMAFYYRCQAVKNTFYYLIIGSVISKCYLTAHTFVSLITADITPGNCLLYKCIRHKSYVSYAKNNQTSHENYGSHFTCVPQS